MIQNIILVLSKIIKPFIKKNIFTSFSIFEEIMLTNIFLFSVSLILHLKNGNKFNFFNKINVNNYKIILIYLTMTILEIFIGNSIIKNSNLVNSKIIQKSLYILLTPIIGKLIFNTNINNSTYFGIILIILGIFLVK